VQLKEKTDNLKKTLNIFYRKTTVMYCMPWIHSHVSAALLLISQMLRLMASNFCDFGIGNNFESQAGKFVKGIIKRHQMQ